MKKTPKIIISIVVLVAIAGAVYYFVKPKTSPNEGSPQADASEAVKSGQVIEKVNNTGNSVDKVNPFNVDVNPYQGYKNPFN